MELARPKFGATYDIVWYRSKVGTTHNIKKFGPWVEMTHDATWSCEVGTKHDVIWSLGENEECRAR